MIPTFVIKFSQLLCVIVPTVYFFEVKLTTKNMFYFSLICLITIFLYHFLSAISFLIFILLIFLGMKFLTPITNSKTLFLLIALITLTSSILLNILSTFLDYFLNFELSQFTSILITVFLIILVLKKFKYFVKIPPDKFIFRLWAFFGILIMVALTLLFYLYYQDTYSRVTPKLYWSSLIAVSVSIVFVTLLIFLLTKRYHTMQLERIKNVQLDNMLQYVNHIETLYNDLSGFQHDYLNLLSSINIALKKQSIEGIEKIYNSSLNSFEQSILDQSFSFAPLRKINIPQLKCLLYSKLILAYKNNIHFTLEVDEHIHFTYINLEDFCIIVDILIKNALEAQINCKYPHIKIAFLKIEKKHILTIQNTFSNNIDLKKIYLKDYSSKKGHQGIGLFILKNILIKYEYTTLETTIENNWFSQKITFKCKD